MRVVLIYAKIHSLSVAAFEGFEEGSDADLVNARDEIYPPLGITTLAAWLEKDGHEVRLRDDSIHSLDELEEQMRWAEVVGISALTANARRGRELGRIAKHEIGRPVIVGGPHPTTNPEFFLDADAADVCVHGEGDLTLPELLGVIHQPERWSDVQGITFVRDGELVSTPRRPLLRDVDSIPFPAYHLWDMKRYMALSIGTVVTLMSSRGCPYQCTFCDAEMTPRLYRSMSPERTVDLMQWLVDRYDPERLVFYDDLFTIQRKRVIAICKEILRRGLFVEWTCESRVDTMDFEMLRWMKRAGCVKVYYGLESGSPDMLVTMKKGVSLEKIKRGALYNHQLGMYFKFFVLFGFPEETEKDHACTERLIRETLPDSITVSLLQPIPGTAVYEQLKPHLLVDVAEMDFHYWYATESFKHPNFSHDELKAARMKLIEIHQRTARGIWGRLRRKLTRLRALIVHPELLGDLITLRLRRRRNRRDRRRRDSSPVTSVSRSTPRVA